MEIQGKVIAVLPFVCVFKGHGLLDGRVNRKVLAVEVSEAVGLPQEHIPGHDLTGNQ